MRHQEMKIVLVVMAFGFTVMLAVALMGISDKSRSALDYYDNCIDAIVCYSDQDCYDKDTRCMEITENLFYGKISDNEAKKQINKLK